MEKLKKVIGCFRLKVNHKIKRDRRNDSLFYLF